jgi:hypothetical protein
VIFFEIVVLLPLVSVNVMLADVLLDVFTLPKFRDALTIDDSPENVLLLVTELIVTESDVNPADFRAVS